MGTTGVGGGDGAFKNDDVFSALGKAPRGCGSEEAGADDDVLRAVVCHCEGLPESVCATCLTLWRFRG